ncbi:MAG: type I-E CRISPR-associated protein Cse1/CasA [Gemmatimonadota bacterium]|nr:type I-E CRISPR-associated protein Cse1/CasA [Gemmatimonadota bacterium]
MNLLTDQLIRTRLTDGEVEIQSLPGVYAAMAQDRITAFPALRPHQRHAWHAFLAQLATIAMHRADTSVPPQTSEEWQTLLRGLTPDYTDDEPWCLIVEDPTRPAFMQCPALNGLDDYRGRVTTPDDLDVLVTSKNHDVKRAIAQGGAPEDWIFALIDLQTMAGFLGAGNYGIARMNGGFSTRPCLGLAPAKGLVGAHLFHDVQRMIARRDHLLEDYSNYYAPMGGRALLWIEPWSGTEQADLRTLDPYFIEICRRVRLRLEGNQFVAWTASSKSARINAKAAKGNLGDFWTPVENKDSKALSLSSVGFPYKRLVELLFENETSNKPESMRVEGGTGDQWQLVARGIAGGQGKTEGYHERTDIAFAYKTASGLFRTAESNRLAEIAKAQIEEISEVTDALRFGIAIAASGGKEPSDLTRSDRAHATPFVRRLEAVADAQFFSVLQDRFLAEDGTDAARHRAVFASLLICTARKLHDEAIDSVPCASIHRHRARARATSAFEGRLRRANGVFKDQPEIFNNRETNNVG